MFLFFVVLVILVVFVLVPYLLTRNAFDKSGVIMFFGSPGSGKTTSLVRILAKSRRKRYSNVETKNLGCTYLDSKALKKLGVDYVLPPHSILCIDEAGIDYSNRDFANKREAMSKDQIAYFRYARHLKTCVCFFSQGFADEDAKLRLCCDELWQVTPAKFGLTKLHKVKKEVCVDEETGQIIDGYKFVPYVLGGVIYVVRSKYYKFFNSWSRREDLPFYEDFIESSDLI